ncbi:MULTISPECIES: NfeD family protein [unclassified Thioalkalivibrio]|uniref:NfeD family protein n=1 Tax=unclassified Thioalkalivibrio TaxID=2621013 RepID=UPI0003806460|nr:MULTISPECIES: NfeD family protein [unclassified Thioalkalivibrio]
MELLTGLGGVDLWQIWLVVALVILILDLLLLGGLMSGGGGITLIVAGGAFGAAVAAAFGADLSGQVVGGVAGMIVMAAFVFWIGRHWVRGDDGNLRTQDIRVGREILIVEEQGGRFGVTFLGDFYPARPETGDESLAIGDRVRVVRFEGITAVVTPHSQ